MYKPLTLLIAAALCSGCAYNNAISRGDQQFTEGNYERAVVAYQQAVVTKPNAEKAQQKLAIAQRQLSLWTAQIASAAQRAERDRLSALAAALYQKHAQLKSDTGSASHASDLRKKLGAQYRPQLFIDSATELLDNRSLGKHQAEYRATAANHILMKVQASPVEFTSEQLELIGRHEYVSGTIISPNPKFLLLKNKLQQVHHHQDRLLDKLHHQDLKISAEQHHLSALKNTLKQQRQRLAASDPASSQHQLLIQRIADTKRQTKLGREHLSALRHKHNNLSRRLNNYEAQYCSLESRLGNTPVDVIEDVLSIYEYPLTEVIQTAQLSLKFNYSGLQAHSDIDYSYRDQIYSDSPRTGLQENPREAMSRSELRRNLYAATAQRIAEHSDIAIGDYRQTLLDKALQQADQQTRLDQLIRYAFSDSQPPEPEIRQLINRQLRTEYGTAGTLDINQLLKF